MHLSAAAAAAVDGIAESQMGPSLEEERVDRRSLGVTAAVAAVDGIAESHLAAAAADCTVVNHMGRSAAAAAAAAG